MFGAHFLHLDSSNQLTGHFNAQLQNAILVFADEAVWAGDKSGTGALNRLVTEDTLRIERKGFDAVTCRNFIHMLLASNEDWVIPATFDARRFLVLDVAKTKQQDSEWFAAVERQLFSEGGLAAMLYDLLAMKSTVNLRRVPKTAALFEQKQYSAGPRARWWYQGLQDADMWDGELHKDASNLRADVYNSYIEVVEKADRMTRRGYETDLGRFLRTVLPASYPRTVKHGGQRHWIFPSLAVCRAFYQDLYEVSADEVNWSDVEGSAIQEDVPF